VVALGRFRSLSMEVDERVKVKYDRGVVRVGCPGNERKTKTAVMRQAAGLPVEAIYACSS
jgi:hypothetical protein